MAMTIRVTPAELQRQAQEITSMIDRVERSLDTIEDQINSSKNYWEGDASNMHQQKYQSLRGDIRNTIRELRAHPRNLLTMAGLYTRTESEAQAESGTLSSDVIS